MDRSQYLADPGASAGAGVLHGLTARGALAATAARAPAATAYVDGGLRLRWRDVVERVELLADELAAAGIGAGDVVGVHLPNSAAFALAHFALAELGAVTLLLHAPYAAAELRQLLGITSAVACIAPDAATALKLEPLRALLPALRTVVAVDLDTASFSLDGRTGARRTRAPLEPDLPFVLAPTSGTESPAPKICMHSHDGLLSNARAFVDEAAVNADDVVLAGSGFTHLFGLLALHVALLAGAATIALRTFEPAAFLNLASSERATRVWAVPAQLIDLVACARERCTPLVLREVRTAGAPAGGALVRDVRAVLGAPVTVHWGMSEIGGGISSFGRDLSASGSALGTPIPGARVRFVRDDGTEADAGEPGELWYRRADMFRGYFGDGAQTAAALAPDGWLKTGDLASRDHAGVVHYHARAKDLVNRGGFKIGAAELEAHLQALPAIRRCAVVAVPDPRLGERACLVAQLHDGASLALTDALTLLQNLGVAKFKWPEHLVIVDAMPMTATNKVAKSQVRALAAQRVAAAVHA